MILGSQNIVRTVCLSYFYFFKIIRMTSSILSFLMQDLAFGKHAHSLSLCVSFTQKLLTGTL